MEKFQVNQMHGHISLSDACFLRSVCGDSKVYFQNSIITYTSISQSGMTTAELLDPRKS